jgi:Tol biopolymer transport system component
MKLKNQILVLFIVIFITSLACSIPITNENTAEEIADLAATAVAATLTALAPTEAPIMVVVTEPAPDTPVPDVEPTEIPIKLSPDELRLVFVDSNQNLSTWVEGSSPVVIVNKGDVTQAVLSPDGEWIVFTRTAPDGIDISLWAIRFDGSEQKILVSHTDFMTMPLHPDLTGGATILTISPFMIKFIPGTHTIAFNIYPQFEGPGLIDNKGLWYINVDTGERRSFLSPGQAGHFYFSPNGSQMALVTPTQIDLINTDGSDRRYAVLTYPFVYTYSEYAYHATPLWSGDSSSLRVSIPPQDPLGDFSAPVNIYHLPIDGSPATLLTSITVAPLENAILSPDLNHFAFTEEIGEPTDNLMSLKFADLSGGTPSEFTTGPLKFGDWAPDSSHFTFYQWDPNEYFIGQLGIPGVIVPDVNPVMSFKWMTSVKFFLITRSGSDYQLRMGTLSTPSVEIANLGSGTYNPNYDFVIPLE